MRSFLMILLAVIAAPVFGGMDGLAELGKPAMKRASTFDTSGGNVDRFEIDPGQSQSLDIQGAGCVKHMWITLKSDDPEYLSKVRLRMYWDGDAAPAVDCPIGDFFCLGHGEVNDVVSAAVCVSKSPHVSSPPGQAAFNCYFPMPFANGAKIEAVNGSSSRLIFYAHIDYESYDSSRPVGAMGRFHAQYREEATRPAEDPISNTSGAYNYIILDTEGEGHYVGCNLSVVSKPGDPGKWWEGDDMIFVDGEPWPPSIHGTGTEDYFNNAWGCRREFNSPYYGCSYLRQAEGDQYFNGRFTVYRLHIPDPVAFSQSIRVTVEHGHGNDAGNQYSSVAYWYQKPGSKGSPPKPDVTIERPTRDPKEMPDH